MATSRCALFSSSALLLWLLSGIASDRVQAQSRSPRLIVLLMVDQMRADYIDRYGDQWNSGLRRLLTEGAWFREADYPFANTVTCSGHASVSTGTLPSVHGMIQNSWYDREFGRVVACADDPAAFNLSYGKPVSDGESGFRLLVPTVGDELRAQLSPTPRIVSLSLKARTAATLGGKHPDAIAWVSDQGAWTTSTAYGGLVPEIEKYVATHPVEQQLWSVWDRTLPKSDYRFDERALGVRGDPSTTTFPHVIRSWDDWQESPLADEYLTRMSLDVVQHMKLGGAGRTDMLSIGYSVLDQVGHDFGPNSHEVQDVLVRLDRSVGELLTGLDRIVGRGNYLVALTSDHGVAPTPERSRAVGLDAQRLPGATVTDAAQRAIASVLGRGKYVRRMVNSEIYLEDGVLDALGAQGGPIEKVRQALLSVEGVAAVYMRSDFTPERLAADPVAQKVANSFFPSRSGDIFVIAKPYWLVNNNLTANHGTPYRYDTHVPVVLMGPGIKAGEYLEPVTPLDIAPTLAHLAGITLPFTQGHLLTAALAVPTAPRTTDSARQGGATGQPSGRSGRPAAAESPVRAVLSEAR